MEKPRELSTKLRENEESLALTLGKLIMVFNRLERDIAAIISAFFDEVIGDEWEYVDIFASSHSFAQKLDLLSSLYLHRYKGYERQCGLFQEVVRRLSRYEELRNTYLHSWWGTRKFGDTDFLRKKATIKGRKGLRVVETASLPDEILKLCEDISSVSRVILPDIWSTCKDRMLLPDQDLTSLEKWLVEKHE